MSLLSTVAALGASAVVAAAACSRGHTPTGEMMARTSSAARLASMPAIEMLDADVRDEVRRHGVDPLTEVETVRRFALTAVRAHDQRSLSGVVRPVENPEAVVDELVARVAGFGPLQGYVDDPSVEEIWINEPSWVD